MRKLRNKKGFTLIELVVVIAVIAILAAIAIPYFSGVTQKANASAQLANHNMLETAAAMYVSDHPGVAGTETDLTPTYVRGAIPTGFSVTITAAGGITVSP